MCKYIVKLLLSIIAIIFCFSPLYINFTNNPLFADVSNTIEMNFFYNNKVYKYNTAKLDNINNFYLYSKAQKNKRLGNSQDRGELLQKVLDLGFEPKQAFQYCFKGLEDVISKIQNDIECNAKDAKMMFKPNLSPYFFFEKEKIGYKLDLNSLAKEIVSKLYESNIINITLQPKVLKPSIYYEDIKDYNNLRSSFFTSFNTENANRVHNIKLAISKFNGLKLELGKEYSFNTITGKRTEENGYKPANIIVEKKYVEGFGGGVCQASTTLYNALLLANMDIREVHSHSLVSSYINMGFDAMVNYGSSDLRWVNNTNTEMYVRTFVQGNRVGVQIYGKPDDKVYTYKRITEIEKQISPPKDEIIIDETGEYKHLVNYKDESAYVSYPKNGYKVRAILEKYEDEKLIERKFLRRVTYQATKGVKVIGANPRPSEQIDSQEVSGLNKQTIEFWQKPTIW